MITHPHYRSHMEQVAALGSAAALDPARHPRRYALQQARAKRSSTFVRELNAAPHTPLDAREVLTEKQLQVRIELAERAVWYSDLPMGQAAKAMGISRDKLTKLKAEFDLKFARGYGNQHTVKQAQQ